MNPILAGLLLGLSLIVAIGAQNAFVIRQGLARNHTLLIVLVCAISDTLLILLGTGGFGTIINVVPLFIPIMRWLGVAYLCWFGIQTTRAIFRDEHLDSTGFAKRITASQALKTTLMLTWLNPHVYLDTLIFVGTLANQFGANRWWFALGACLASWIWFFATGFGAKRLSPIMSNATAWKVLDGVISVIMFTLAGVLLFAQLSTR